jgi:putative tryptophan/tyrosine transport system substrate-binding protein
MAVHIRRREFIVTLGGAVAAWSLAARAQQPAIQVAGYLISRSPRGGVNTAAAFRKGLSKIGYGGRNVVIEFHLSSVMLAIKLIGKR